jgi:hypothetical protein
VLQVPLKREGDGREAHPASGVVNKKELDLFYYLGNFYVRCHCAVREDEEQSGMQAGLHLAVSLLQRVLRMPLSCPATP